MEKKPGFFTLSRAEDQMQWKEARLFSVLPLTEEILYLFYNDCPVSHYKQGYKIMPKVVDKKKKRSEIAKSAVEIFARKGFENTTVQEISDRAKIAKGSVYLYFKTKEDILNEASKVILGELEGDLLESLNHQTGPVEKLSALITEGMKITPEFEQIFTVYMEIRLFHLRDNGYEGFIKNFEDTLMNLITVTIEIIEQGKSQGIFRNDANAQALAFYVFGTFDGVVMHYLCDRSGFDIESVADEFLKNFLNGLKFEI